MSSRACPWPTLIRENLSYRKLFFLFYYHDCTNTDKKQHLWRAHCYSIPGLLATSLFIDQFWLSRPVGLPGMRGQCEFWAKAFGW